MKYILILFSLILFASCDGVQEVSGIIVDSETKKPLDKVTIKALSKDFTYYSDENGYFEISGVTGFAFSDNDLAIIISKDKYKTDTIEIKNTEDKLIKMIRME